MTEKLVGPSLPVSGYRPQKQQAIDWVNQNKAFEENALRQLDYFKGLPEVDQRWLAVGRTHLEQAWMAINRAIFQPGRVTLPDDTTGDAA